MLFCVQGILTAQVLPLERRVDWSKAGLQNDPTDTFPVVTVTQYGLFGDGLTANDSALTAILQAYDDTGVILEFPAGEFLFHEPIVLSSHTRLKGEGPDKTTLRFDQGGSQHSLVLQGSTDPSETSFLIEGIKGEGKILVENAAFLTPGDWIWLRQNDSLLIFSDWALGHVGQIVHIDSISGNQLFVNNGLRLDYDTSLQSYVQKISPIKGVGIECLKIIRDDDSYPEKTSNIYLDFAVNCWIESIESQNCAFSHIEMARSAHLALKNSFLHHGFGYGSGGRAYGVTLHYSTGQCLIENNIFEHLRHAILLQAGANGNVISFNYSFDPFWENSGVPSDAAGDIVLHGNYPFANLFEYNVCQNIWIDNSHGANGPYNTFFRNKAEKYGILFTADNSPSQNFLGNEITNTTLPYSLFNYTILGSDHFLYGNNNKGTAHPPGTENLPDSSYFYEEKPTFVLDDSWVTIGYPNALNSGTTPAVESHLNSTPIFTCGDVTSGFRPPKKIPGPVALWPNPVYSQMVITSYREIKNVTITNIWGQKVITLSLKQGETVLNLQNLPIGTYWFTFRLRNGVRVSKQVQKR